MYVKKRESIVHRNFIKLQLCALDAKEKYVLYYKWNITSGECRYSGRKNRDFL